MSTNVIKNGYVYLIQNDINAKKYIGCTIKNPEHRFKEHIRTAIIKKSPMYNDFNTYGIKNFSLFTIGHLIDCTRDMIEALENDYIASYQPEYNIRAKIYNFGRVVKNSQPSITKTKVETTTTTTIESKLQTTVQTKTEINETTIINKSSDARKQKAYRDRLKVNIGDENYKLEQARKMRLYRGKKNQN